MLLFFSLLVLFVFTSYCMFVIPCIMVRGISISPAISKVFEHCIYTGIVISLRPVITSLVLSKAVAAVRMQYTH